MSLPPESVFPGARGERSSQWRSRWSLGLVALVTALAGLALAIALWRLLVVAV